jgi:hypothetical protein
MDDTALEDGLDEVVTQLDVSTLEGSITTSIVGSDPTTPYAAVSPLTIQTKTCGSCKLTKPLKDFYKHKSSRDGHQSCCGQCARQSAKAWNQKNQTVVAERLQHRRLNRPALGALEVSRSRAKRAGHTPIKADPEALNAYILNHDGRCDVCGDTCPTNSRLCVDHCHETGLVRGMLCQPCNVAAGRLRDDWRRAVSMARYLKAFEEALRPAFANPLTLQLGAMP